jgi:uncharacterized protein YfaT (DUF1175 family)
MNELLEKLHDIEGLDPINWWPLAPGWWGVIAVGCALIFAICWFAASKMAFRKSWRCDTFQKLAALEAHLSDASTREVLISLSEYLRRIALQRFPRQECAGLVGDAWLKWLTKHDPNNFDWESKGVLLIDAPYAPMNKQFSSDQVKELIQATKKWVR